MAIAFFFPISPTNSSELPKNQLFGKVWSFNKVITTAVPMFLANTCRFRHTHTQKQTLKDSSEQREKHSLHNVNILMNSLTLSTLRIAMFMENLPPTLDRGMMCPSWPALLIGTLDCTFRFSTILRNIGKWNETSGSTSMYIYIQSQSFIKKVYSTVSYIPTQLFQLNCQNRGAKVGNSRAMVVPTRARLESCLKWVAVKTCD